jgi:hypothetical protein
MIYSALSLRLWGEDITPAAKSVKTEAATDQGDDDEGVAETGCDPTEHLVVAE